MKVLKNVLMILALPAIVLLGVIGIYLVYKIVKSYAADDDAQESV